MTRAELAAVIDHTLLKPTATGEDIERLCQEAAECGFRTVCVNPVHVREAAGFLKAAATEVCSVAGFPLGASRADVKAREAARAVEDGAAEIDMVANIGALRAGELGLVASDIAAVVSAGGPVTIVKVIIEAAFLTDEEKVTACRVAVDAGAAFVKTSTGFGPGGATVEDVRLMRATVGPDVGVKAAGGIRDYLTAIRMLEAGASRIGASASVAIIDGAEGPGEPAR